ncbi:hypothetical protein [Actinoalloteichus spitiensis]|uniref:hypothetical protein n=1 Tax=Actinoalloteichus spitiensis TaxID=252394 RepID=UPI000382DF89|nr:hypothetical protein [Actinoalloteichus spitiensis]
MAIRQPRFGERTVSWRVVLEESYPRPDEDYRESGQAHHENAEAAEMNHLRGQVMVQASETEAVLGMILRHLDPSATPQGRTMGRLLNDVTRHLGDNANARWSYELGTIGQAVERRNRAVHERVDVGSVWRDYATGGGEWVSVISFLGGEEHSESDLIENLALQQEATSAAVDVLYAVERETSGESIDRSVDPSQK